MQQNPPTLTPDRAPAQATPYPHRLHEDALALLIGSAIVALGLTLYAEAMLLTGSTAGLALLVQYATGIGFGWVFFAINLPFYALALIQMGRAFTIRTFVAVALVSARRRGGHQRRARAQPPAGALHRRELTKERPRRLFPPVAALSPGEALFAPVPS